MVKTPSFQSRGHGLDPWSGKYDLTGCVVRPKKKKDNPYHFMRKETNLEKGMGTFIKHVLSSYCIPGCTFPVLLAIMYVRNHLSVYK